MVLTSFMRYRLVNIGLALILQAFETLSHYEAELKAKLDELKRKVRGGW